ncbi:MAG: arsenate reductase family protein [Deltaproteobacteria bacterium]|nr:arsenate reductase family protein [Deltaproteobacteria bacterium]
MNKIKVYEYNKCSTCRKAIKFLDAHNIPYETLPIVEQAPTKKELHKMLTFYGGDITKLFNTSGVVYREMGLGKKIKSMDTNEAIHLLSSRGKLVKRPFMISELFGLVGFKEEEWRENLGAGH